MFRLIKQTHGWLSTQFLRLAHPRSRHLQVQCLVRAAFWMAAHPFFLCIKLSLASLIWMSISFMKAVVSGFVTYQKPLPML
jgi:hypothetical protein